MLSTPVVEPDRQSPIHLVPTSLKNPAATKFQDETNPFVIVLVAAIVAFHIAALLTGLMTAWVYYFRNSGAFAP